MTKKPTVQSPKTIIGVLASHDDYEVNDSLLKLLQRVYNDSGGSSSWRQLLEQFQFVFTGGTYERIIDGHGWYKARQKDEPPSSFSRETANWLRHTCQVVRLPKARDGGVTMLASLVAYRQCSIVWGLLSPATGHWINPENLAFMRLCDHWRVKRLMNTGSIIEWIRTQAKDDVDRNRQPLPLVLRLAGLNSASRSLDTPAGMSEAEWGDRLETMRPEPAGWNDDRWRNREWGKMTVALIAHDDMKQRMVDFALDHEPELARFGRILATGTTGKEIMDAVPRLGGKVVRCHSGPKGGDIQIATEIVLGYCDVVVFFVDPLHPQPHIDDIRVVFGACMARPSVRMITNEIQAREWMETVIRRTPVSPTSSVEAKSQRKPRSRAIKG